MSPKTYLPLYLPTKQTTILQKLKFTQYQRDLFNHCGRMARLCDVIFLTPTNWVK